MNFHRSKTALAAVLVSFFPLVSAADISAAEDSKPTAKQAESFQAICLSSWMKRVSNVENEATYKSFGEKYCACALTQPLETDDAVNEAIRVCLSRTLLHSAMDSLATKIGLDKASDKDIGQSCLDTWNLIYPKMSDQAKQTAAGFCDCSQPKLVELLKSTGSMTDKEYYAQIDATAASCFKLGEATTSH